MIKNKNILIGICGGIAAYKTISLISLLKNNNNNIKIILTKNAEKFVTPLTLKTISNDAIYDDMFALKNNIAHISLTQFADLMIVAPATANIIAKYHSGIADDLLSTTLISFNKDIFFVPAMNTNMYLNPITQNNIISLKNKINYLHFLIPDSGKLACGTEGIGRMPEPENILIQINQFYNSKKIDKNTKNFFYKKKVLITAGPTREYIDPVRYITNESSGLQGYTLANKFCEQGAEVTLITGPTNIQKILNKKINVINVITALEMFEKVKENFPKANFFISTSAVADYKPKNTSTQKIKKNEDIFNIILEKNPDILKWCGTQKTKNQTIVGFAAETENLINNAQKKLKEKNCDFIIANRIKDSINKKTNKITILTKSGITMEFPYLDKNEVSEIIIKTIIENKDKWNENIHIRS